MSFFVPRGPPTTQGSLNLKTIECGTMKVSKINMDDGKVSNLNEPINPSDAATKNYVDSQSFGGNLSGPIFSTNGVTGITDKTGTGTTFVMDNSPVIINLSAGNSIISNVLNPLTGTDVANKLYVDGHPGANLTGPISSINGVTNITSQTGSGTTFVTNTSPVLITPYIGSATGNSLITLGPVTSNQLISTVSTGTPPLIVTSTTQVPNLKSTSSVSADTVTTNANLTGPITSVGNTTSINSQTGTGTTFVMNDGPTLITPNIGSATGNSLSTSGIITTAAQLISTVANGTSPFMVTSTTQVANLKSTSSASADTVVTNANLTGPITSVGNTTSINSKTGTGNTFVMDTSPVINNLSGGNTVISNVSNPSAGSDAANKSYVDSLTTNPLYTATVQKNPGPGEFGSIEAALASITTSSETEPWIVKVEPGVYDENVLVVPPYVSIKGSSIIPTVIRPIVPNQYLFVMGNSVEISFLNLKGIDGSLSPGAGAGYAAIYCMDVGDYAQLHKVSIYDFDIGIDNYANTEESVIYAEYVDINGDYSYAVRNRSVGGFNAKITLEDFFSFPSNSVIQIAILNDGTAAKVQLTGSSLYGNSSMKGIVGQNGGEILIGAILMQDFGTAVVSQNIGAGAILKIDGSTFNNCTLDFNVLNVGTSGYFFGNSPRNNHSIVNGSSFFMANQDNNIINVAKRGGDYTSIKAAVDSITNASPSNIYLVKIGPGIFFENTITLSPGIFLLGYFLNATTIVPTNPDSTVVILSDISYIKDVYITGATGINGVAISFQGSIGLGTLVRDCAFGNNTVNIKVFGNTVSTLIVVDRCSILGNCTECIVVTNNPGVQTRITVVNTFYRDLVIPIATTFFRASGLGVTVNIISSLILVTTVAGSKAYSIGNGVDFRIMGSSIIGFDYGIYVPTGLTDPCIVNGSGTLINYSGTNDLYIGSANTIGSWDGEVVYTKVYIPISSSFYLSGKNQTVITVRKSGGDFMSIAAAINSITQNTSINRYTIQVGPGTYTEPEIVMKPYVSIYGDGRSTRILPDSAFHHIIRGADFAELSSVILTGCGAGYAAIYQETPTGTSSTALICRNILFGVNDLHVWCYGDIGQAHIIIYTSRFGGTAQFNYGFRATNNNNNITSKITIVSTVSQGFTSPLPSYVCYASGSNCAISLNGFNIINDGSIEVGTYGIKVDNSALVRFIACTIRGFDTAICALNFGNAPSIVSNGCTITDCTTDINIQHPQTSGSISISAMRSKTIVNNSPPLTMFLIDPTDKGIVINGPLYYSKDNFNNNSNVSDLLTDTPTMGVLSGGVISVEGTLLTITISAGTGYLVDGVSPNDNVIFKEWGNTNLILTANSNLYIYFNGSNIITSSVSYPNTISNILFGYVSTYTDIIYIQNIKFDARHYSNNVDLLLKDALGPVYASGSAITEIATDTQTITATAGIYFFTNTKFSPVGASPVTFTSYYRSSTPGIYTSTASQTIVPSGFYDNGSGTLVALVAGEFTKHILLLFGGPSEQYILVYGQETFATQGLAIAGSLPLVPSFVSNSFVRVASLVMKQGVAGIDTILDERPRLGFTSSSVAGTITVHGDLTGLAANDHPQYLLANGGAPGMTGDLNMNSNNIVSPGLYNGFDVSTHASRHAFNGPDPLNPALSANIAELTDSVSFQGTNNTMVPRADHVHAHGNRGGGTLHAAVIAAGASGFMTGVDKTKLDGIATGATNTTPSDIAPANVTKTAASAGISVEVSRADHKHNISTATAVGLLTNSTNSEGSATTIARSDHTHTIASDVPVVLGPDEAIAIGNSTAFSRADHIHNIPTGVASGLNATSASATGAANTFSRSNHTHAIASGVPSNQTIALVTSTGTSANFARADHIHTFSTATPANIGTLNTEGTSTSFARSDHIHAHGAQTDGTLHAVVIASGASGFMSGTDKTKLDGIASGATNTSLTNTAPVNVDKSAASVGISTEVARSDHKHDISTGVASGLTATSTNIEGSSTSLARSDHTHAIASGVPSNQTIAVTALTGASSNFARADHIHTFSTAVPNSIGNANTEGTSTSFSRADHVHVLNLTGPITSSGTTTSITSQTGSGTTFVMNNSPTLVTPIIGAATGTSLNVSGTLKSGTGIIIEDPGAGTNSITLQTPSGLSANYTLTLPVDDGIVGQLLATDGNGVLNWTNTGPNVVTNSGTSTDTSIVRFSGTTGKAIQNSSVLIGNAGEITGVNTIGMSGQLTSSVSTGTAPFVVSSTTQVSNLNAATAGTATNSLNSSMTDDTTTNAVMYPTWVTATSGNLPQKVSSSKLNFNPSTGILTSTGFSGSLTNGTGLPLTTGVTGILLGTNGGTGINNGSRTITLGGNLATSGAFNTTLTTTGTTTLTLPVSGTIMNNSLNSGQIYVGNVSNIATGIVMSGDATIDNTGALTLATVNSGPGSTTLSSITTNAKGLVTSNTTQNLSGDVTTSGLTTTYNNVVPLAKGGTNAALTANNGGIFYSTASAGAILSGTATANRVLLSGISAAPSWSATTYPSSTIVNQLLYSSATDTVSGVSIVNSAGLTSTAGGVPTWIAATGTGAPVFATGPTLVTPNIGAAIGTSLTTSGLLRSNTSLILEDPGVGTNTITIQSSTLGANYILTLPTTAGSSNGQVLSTNGSGVLSWSSFAPPLTISTANAEGTATTLARSDHVHALNNPFQQVQSTTSQTTNVVVTPPTNPPTASVTGASITTSVTGNYMISFNASGITSNTANDITTTFQIFNNGVAIPTAQGNCFTTVIAPVIFNSVSIITIANLTAGQPVSVRWAVSAASTITLPRFEFNIVMLSA